MSKLRINYSEIVKRLKEYGFSDEEISKIGGIFNSFPFIVDVNNGLVEAGDQFKIKIYNTKMEKPEKSGDLLLTGWFDLEIDGLDPNKVLSVELPKLDIRDVKILSLNVELLTTDLVDTKIEKL